MNRKYAAVALSAMAMGTIALTATEASAVVQEPAGSVRLPPEPTNRTSGGSAESPVEIPVDDAWAEAAQAGASALGGAGIAFAGVWVYRRRQPLAGQ